MRRHGEIPIRSRSRRQASVFSSRAVGLAVTLVFTIALAVAEPATAQDRGVQTTPGQEVQLVSKDVGNERWSIAIDLSTGTAIGNVFPKTGGPPQFVWCSLKSATLGATPDETSYMLDCFGASACPSTPCTVKSWTFISTVELPGTFVFSP